MGKPTGCCSTNNHEIRLTTATGATGIAALRDVVTLYGQHCLVMEISVAVAIFSQGLPVSGIQELVHYISSVCCAVILICK